MRHYLPYPFTNGYALLLTIDTDISPNIAFNLELNYLKIYPKENLSVFTSSGVFTITSDSPNSNVFYRQNDNLISIYIKEYVGCICYVDDLYFTDFKIENKFFEEVSNLTQAEKARNLKVINSDIRNSFIRVHVPSVYQLPKITGARTYIRLTYNSSGGGDKFMYVYFIQRANSAETQGDINYKQIYTQGGTNPQLSYDYDTAKLTISNITQDCLVEIFNNQ